MMDPPPPEPDKHRDIRKRFPELIKEFHAIASRLLRRWPARSMASDDLVSEAFLKLVSEEVRRIHNKRSDLGEQPDATLKACFAAACRDVMSVRHRKRERRKEVDQTVELQCGRISQFDLSDIAELLSVLAIRNSEAAEVADARIFGGMTVGECSEAFGVSKATIDRRWALAKAWIKDELKSKE